jgi:hypothetical protein
MRFILLFISFLLMGFVLPTRQDIEAQVELPPIGKVHKLTSTSSVTENLPLASDTFSIQNAVLTDTTGLRYPAEATVLSVHPRNSRRSGCENQAWYAALAVGCSLSVIAVAVAILNNVE